MTCFCYGTTKFKNAKVTAEYNDISTVSRITKELIRGRMRWNVID